MTDRRTKKQKLRDMANQSVSPNEAAIAKEKLAALPDDPEPEPTVIQHFRPSGVHIAFDFGFPFNQTEGEGIFTYDFKTQKWIKIG